MLNMNQLRAFYHVAKSLSFSAAAEDLYVSQPAVSKQIKLFEEVCNLKLFIWRKNRLYLTDEGKKILVYASRIFDLEKQLEDTINDFRSHKQGSLHIGTTKTYAKFLMPVLLAPFQQMFPGIIIDLDEGSSLAMTESLLDFRNSLAIIAKVRETSDILFCPLLLDEIVLIASPRHHLAERGPISIESLCGENLVIKEHGSGTRKYVERIVHDKGILLNFVAQTSNMDFIKQLVKKQHAISFVVKTSVELELAKKELVTIPIKNQKFSLEVYLAYLQHYELPLAAKAFENFILSILGKSKSPLEVNDFLAKIPNRVPSEVCSQD